MPEELSSPLHQDGIDAYPSQQIGPGSKYNAQNSGPGSATVNVYEHVSPRPMATQVIEAARDMLAALPLDYPPASGMLPSASRLAFSHHPSFVGRENELVSIAEVLKARDLATVAIAGLGGVGKSQLASEFVYRYGQYFAGGVFWLSFADAKAVPAEVAGCTIALGQELRLDARTLPVEEQVHLVLSCWQTPLPRLLVFDNCEDEELLASFRPHTGGCRLLLTTRRSVWDPTLGVIVQNLDVLPRAKSVELLGTYRSNLSASSRELIAQELGDLPLALSLAGSYLHTYQQSRLGDPQHYLLALRQMGPLDHKSFQQEGITSTTGHSEHVARTFALSYEQLQSEDPIDATALQVLARVTCFAPGEPIPYDLLHRTMGTLSDDEQEDRFIQALERVHALGLLQTQQEGTQHMHRLLFVFVRERMASSASTKDAQISVGQALRDLAWEKFRAVSPPSSLLRVQEHLRAVTAHANERRDALAADLHEVLGIHFYRIGVYQEAQHHLQQALEIRQQEVEPNRSAIARIWQGLALLYQAQGNYEKAEQLYLQLLEIYQQELEPTHPAITRVLRDLAFLYRAQGNYEKAEQLYQQALETREKAESADPAIADSLEGLALIAHARGNYEKAEQLYRQALEIYQQALEPTHPTIASCLRNLALITQGRGNYEKAEQLYQQALEIYQQKLEPTDPAIADTLQGLALLSEVQGNYEKAEQLYQQALEIHQQELGPTHPHIARNLQGLALLYQNQENYEKAEQLHRQALEIREQVLVPTDPTIAESLYYLAFLIQNRGSYAEAEPLLRRAVTIREQALGPDHPFTVASLNNLGLLCMDQGNYTEAEPLLRRALAIRERVLGPDDLSTAASLNNLALFCKDRGSYAEAERLYQRALEIRERVEGPDHIGAAFSLNKLALLYEDQGMYVEAEPLLRRALAIYEQALGSTHPTTEKILKRYLSVKNSSKSILLPCGHPRRSTARFCSVCGQPIVSAGDRQISV